MADLSLLEQESLEILKQLQYCCDQFELFNKKKEGEAGIEVKILTDELKVTTILKEEDRLITLFTIAKYLEGRGLNFSLTPDYINDNPSEQVHEGGDYDVIGVIRGESIQDIKTKIEELISELNPKEPIKDVDENILVKGKKKIALPKFPPTDWSKIEIRFLDENNIHIKAGQKTAVADYESLGFCDDRKRKPNTAWVFLFLLAKRSGESPKIQSPVPDKTKNQKKVLSDRLKTIFKNDTDPFYEFSATNTYKIKITLLPPMEEKTENDFGTGEYLKEEAPSI